MTQNINRELAQLKRMSVGELQTRFAEVFGEPTNGRHKTWLQKKIAWRLQANAFGGLSERAVRRAAQLANESDLRSTAPRESTKQESNFQAVMRTNPIDERLPPISGCIERVYKGQQHIVMILADGFEYEGKKYKTLSAIAKQITGQHWNGYRFFNLNRTKGTR